MAFMYKKVTTPRAKKMAGMSVKVAGKKPALGEGGRFKAMVGALKKKGAKKPEALAAWIGRKNLGKAKFQKLASKGKKMA